jgi:hypothetical protein
MARVRPINVPLQLATHDAGRAMTCVRRHSQAMEIVTLATFFCVCFVVALRYTSVRPRVHFTSLMCSANTSNEAAVD